jgi:hypothetical protein
VSRLLVASLVLPPVGVDLPFDDLEVQQARRLVLAGPPFDLVTTFVRDSRFFDGSLIVARTPAQRAAIGDDPFTRLFPARRLEVPDGLLPTRRPPAGPVIERYGRPWPQDGFR